MDIEPSQTHISMRREKPLSTSMHSMSPQSSRSLFHDVRSFNCIRQVAPAAKERASYVGTRAMHISIIQDGHRRSTASIYHKTSAMHRHGGLAGKSTWHAGAAAAAAAGGANYPQVCSRHPGEPDPARPSSAHCEANNRMACGR